MRLPATVWAPLGERLAQSLGIERPVTFLSGDEDAMPMACGLVRARVLLPAEADDWPIERQRVVLLHELAHVKRRDCLTQMLAHLACATYWFNPLVWLAARRLRAERERACDDLVLAAGTRGSDYADHLLDIARSLAQRCLANLVCGDDGAPLTTRGKTHGDTRSGSASSLTHSPLRDRLCRGGDCLDCLARWRATGREGGGTRGTRPPECSRCAHSDAHASADADSCADADADSCADADPGAASRGDANADTSANADATSPAHANGPGRSARLRRPPSRAPFSFVDVDVDVMQSGGERRGSWRAATHDSGRSEDRRGADRRRSRTRTTTCGSKRCTRSCACARPSLRKSSPACSRTRRPTYASRRFPRWASFVIQST